MAMSGLAEYNGFFIDCLTSVISKLPNNQHFEFAFSQIISSVAQLNIDTSEVEDFTYHIGRWIEKLGAMITDQHAFMLAPTLWGLTNLQFYNEALFESAFDILASSIDNLTKFDLLLLNQVFNSLRAMGLVKKRDYYDLQQVSREQALRYEDEITDIRLQEIDFYRGRDLMQMIKDVHNKASQMMKFDDNVSGELKELVFNDPIHSLGYKNFIELDGKVLIMIDPLIKNNDYLTVENGETHFDGKINGFNKLRIQQLAHYCNENGKTVVIKDVDDIIDILQNEDQRLAIQELFN